MRPKTYRRTFLLPLVVPMAAVLLASTSTAADTKDYSIMVGFGRITDGRAHDVFTGDLAFQDANLIVGAFGWTMGRFCCDALHLELEGQVGKWTRDQTNWEFDLAVIGRWREFPWSRVLATSVAWGIGPSYATEEPAVEIAVNGGSERWLCYWMAEITAGPPKGNWEALVRVHHRSAAFGLFGELGGSNTLLAGLRYRF